MNRPAFVRLRDLSPTARAFIVYGLLFDAVQNFYRPFGVTFLERLGGTAPHIFFLNYMPALFSGLALLPSLFVIRGVGDTGRSGYAFLILSRCSILAFAGVPFLPEGMRPWGLVLATSLIVMFETLSQSALQAYLGHALDIGSRASAISRRMASGQAVIVAVVLASGALLRFLPGPSRLPVYQGLLAFGFCLGLAEIVAFRRLVSSAGPQYMQTKVGPSLRRMAKDRGFLAFAGSALVFYFGWQLGWPLFSVWQVKYLRADEAWMSALSVASGVVMFASYPAWRRIIDKRGLSFALGLATLGQAVNPVFICLADSMPLQLACTLFTGFFTAGVSVGFLAGLMGASPESDDRICYAAAYNTAINLCQVVSQQLGLVIFHATDIRAAMLIDAAIRGFGAGAFILLWMKGARPSGACDDA